MSVSIFDLFKIGIGPSSSHTVGPMLAAHEFASELRHSGVINHVVRVSAELFGSLALTGRGHGSDKAILLGLSGELPDKVKPDSIEEKIAAIKKNREIRVLNIWPIAFHSSTDLVLHRRRALPGHPNGMRFSAFNADEQVINQRTYYSIGGGAISAKVNWKISQRRLHYQSVLVRRQKYPTPTPPPVNC